MAACSNHLLSLYIRYSLNPLNHLKQHDREYKITHLNYQCQGIHGRIITRFPNLLKHWGQHTLFIRFTQHRYTLFKLHIIAHKSSPTHDNLMDISSLTYLCLLYYNNQLITQYIRLLKIHINLGIRLHILEFLMSMNLLDQCPHIQHYILIIHHFPLH